jgi:hypothetical protein
MWSELEQALSADAIVVHGTTAGWAAWLAAELADREPANASASIIVVVTPDDLAARALEADIRFFRGGTPDRAVISTRSRCSPASTSRRMRTCRRIARASSSASRRCTG